MQQSSRFTLKWLSDAVGPVAARKNFIRDVADVEFDHSAGGDLVQPWL